MTGALPMLDPQTLPDMSSVTFSQALEAGLTHYDWLDGKTIDPAGRDLALASHSVSQEKAKDLMTQDTCGPLFVGLSLSADLQQSLENRLHQRMEGLGSPEYVLTWKQWDIGSEPPICAQRASGHRTSGKDCGGWPTTRMTDGEKGTRTDEGAYRERMRRKNGYDLPSAAMMTGWSTPRANDAEKRGTVADDPRNGLVTQANQTGWPTPQATEARQGFQDRSRGKKGSQESLTTVVVKSIGSPQSIGFAEMENIGEFLPDGWKMPENGRLNPRFSLWLMQYPIAWASCGERVTR